MDIPEETLDKENFCRYVTDICMASQNARRSLYEKRRLYYLYGQNNREMVKFNRLKSHIALLTSFLYASEQASYSVAAPKNGNRDEHAMFLAIEDEWNESFRDSGLADLFDQALTWGIVYDTMMVKQGWNDIINDGFATLIEPSSFGVFHENLAEFSAQPAMAHSYLLEWDDACERLERAGRRDAIQRLSRVNAGEGQIGFGGTLGQMIISATGGANLSGGISGSVNPSYEAAPSYTPRMDAPMTEFIELWVWDSASKDWRIFIQAAPGVILSDSKEVISVLKRNFPKQVKFDSDTNYFLDKENPFTPVTPYPIYNYFWGDCHLEDLIPLQNWSTDRLEQIAEILEKQVDPPKSFAGFMSLNDEDAEAFGGPGTAIHDQLPGAKVDIHAPQMPEDLFGEFMNIGNLFMEQSGFTELMAGRGERNVRGRGHARELKQTGGGRVKKVAAGLEKPLVRLGDIALRLKARNDDEKLVWEGANGQPNEFLISQVLGATKYTMRIAGHSHSPLFTSELHEIASALFRAQAIDPEWLIRLLRPPQMDQLIAAYKNRAKMVAAQRAANPAASPAAGRAAKGKQGA